VVKETEWETLNKITKNVPQVSKTQSSN